MIPASLLIILILLVGAVLAYFLRRWRSVEVLIAAICCGLGILILSRPIDAPAAIGGININLQMPVNLFGRVLAVRSTEQMPLLLFFIVALVLFLLGLAVSQGWTFVPLGMIILAMLSTGLMIRPFVYAALAFEAAAAVAAIMIQAERSGQNSTRGAFRYLIISTLALPAFLGAGYVIAQAAGINDPVAQVAAYGPAAVLLGIGFVLMIGALPIFTWTFSVVADAPPLTAALLATIGVGAVAFLFVSLKQDYAWFTANTDVRSLCNLFGLATILIGCVLGWTQTSFGRVIACGLSVEIGSTLLLLNQNNAYSVEVIAFGIAARALSLGVLGVGISILRERAGSDDFTQIGGLGRKLLWPVLAIAVGGLSLAGLPGTVGFVSRWTAARVLGQTDLEVLVLTLVAGASVGAGFIRGLFALFSHALADDKPLPDRHGRRQAITIAVGVVLVVLMGIVPGVAAPVTRTIAENYTYLK
ncbi:MAG TPA: proton-conducting transporter membrane subunit [Anaerolineae bacterium]